MSAVSCQQQLMVPQHDNFESTVDQEIFAVNKFSSVPYDDEN